MSKLIKALLLTTTISTTISVSVLADSNSDSKPMKQESLLEKIFNTTAYDDGCVTYPMCDFDINLSERERMELQELQDGLSIEPAGSSNNSDIEKETKRK